MDWDTVKPIVSAVAGGVFTLGATFLKSKLSGLSEAKGRTRRALKLAYHPAVAHIDAMIDPDQDPNQARDRLRALMLDQGSLFEAEDRPHLWVAISDRASPDDVVRVRQLLAAAIERLERKVQ
jgi:hypothetical protein